MPFTVPASSYIGGQLWAQGLSNLGQGIAGGLAAYHKAHQDQLQAEQTALQLTQTPGYDGKPILSQSAYERLMASGSGEHASRVAGLLDALKLGMAGQEAQSQAALRAAQGSYYKARGQADLLEQADYEPPASEVEEARKGGKVPVHESRTKVKWEDIPQEADTDEQGNPVLSQDRAFYRTTRGGKQQWVALPESARKSLADYDAKKAQVEQIRADYRAKKITLEEATKQIRELGITSF